MPTLRLTYRVPAEREEEAVTTLWEAGTLGVEEVAEDDGALRLEAYFEEGSVGTAPEALAGGELVRRDVVPDADWLAPWRELAPPLPVGERLLLDPRDPEEAARPAPVPGRTTLRIPARGAFGTGSHESTRLVLELLEGVDLRGRRVLDVGCGTGILSFAALAFGADAAVAFDRDPAAPAHARQNAALNRGVCGAPLLFAGTLGALRPPIPERAFGLALVNVVPEEILPEVDRLPPLLSPGADALFSGILSVAAGPVARRLASVGLELVGERTAGEWIALHARVPELVGRGGGSRRRARTP